MGVGGQDGAGYRFDDGRDDSVSACRHDEASNLVGQSMSHAYMAAKTAGPLMDRWPNVSFKGRELRAMVAGEALPERQSLAAGEGSIIVWIEGRTFPLRVPSGPNATFVPYGVALGVGSIRAASDPGHFAMDGLAEFAVLVGECSIFSALVRFSPRPPVRFGRGPAVASLARHVGSKPDDPYTVSNVRRPEMASTHQSGQTA